MEPSPLKIFTVKEANGLTATMEAVMGEIRRLVEEARAHHERLQVLDVLWGEKVQESQNPDHGEFREHETAMTSAARRVEAMVREEILARGIRFPMGGLEHGLLDFPTTLDGRIVFLCWQLGESAVEYWHEVDGGYAGRQPITPDIAERMGIEDA